MTQREFTLTSEFLLKKHTIITIYHVEYRGHKNKRRKFIGNIRYYPSGIQLLMKNTDYFVDISKLKRFYPVQNADFPAQQAENPRKAVISPQTTL